MGLPPCLSHLIRKVLQLVVVHSERATRRPHHQALRHLSPLVVVTTGLHPLPHPRVVRCLQRAYRLLPEGLAHLVLSPLVDLLELLDVLLPALDLLEVLHQLVPLALDDTLQVLLPLVDLIVVVLLVIVRVPHLDLPLLVQAPHLHCAEACHQAKPLHVGLLVVMHAPNEVERGHVPDGDRTISAPCPDLGSRRILCQAVDGTWAVVKELEQLAGLGVPDFERPVLCSREEEDLVDHQAGHTALVPHLWPRVSLLLPRLKVPAPDGVVLTTRVQVLTPVVHQAQHTALVPAELLGGLQGLGRPLEDL
eukprot:Sspe_Gene.31548::Locus_15551_Transcript_1_1_Confidence_1.000_Length_2783::g.31548::m.31548